MQINRPKRPEGQAEFRPPNPFRQRQEQRRRDRGRRLGGQYAATIGISTTDDPEVQLARFEAERIEMADQPEIQPF